MDLSRIRCSTMDQGVLAEQLEGGDEVERASVAECGEWMLEDNNQINEPIERDRGELVEAEAIMSDSGCR